MNAKTEQPIRHFLNGSTRKLSIIETRKEISLQTDFWAKPIPIRRFDWSAIDEQTYDASWEGDHWECSPQGFGQSENEAIADLFEQMELRNA